MITGQRSPSSGLLPGALLALLACPTGCTAVDASASLDGMVAPDAGAPAEAAGHDGWDATTDDTPRADATEDAARAPDGDESGPVDTGSDACASLCTPPCSGGACCTNTCTPGGASQCGGGGIQSCQTQSNGCNAVATTPCASGLVCERASGPVCRDPNWAEWPISTVPTYTDNGNGTVSDKSTGLMWEQEASPNTYTWGSTSAAGTAQNYCATLAVAGYGDWRLPTYIELLSIVDYARTNPAINAAFLNTQYTGFWTSTPAASPSGLAWAVYFDNGATDYNGVSNTYYARCVR